jgi:hypothetical protein
MLFVGASNEAVSDFAFLLTSSSSHLPSIFPSTILLLHIHSHLSPKLQKGYTHHLYNVLCRALLSTMPRSRSRKTNFSGKAFSRGTPNKQTRKLHHTRSTTSREHYATDVCWRCSRLDLNSTFNPTQLIPPVNGRFILALKPLQYDTACPMCSFFKSLVVDTCIRNSSSFGAHVRDSFQLRAFSAARLFGVSQPTTYGSPVVALAVILGISRVRVNLTNMGDYNHGFALPRSKESLPVELRPAIEVTAVETNQVDYHQLNSWLEDCNLSHSGCGETNRSQGLSVPLKCIDCHNKTIVQVRDDDDYFALSYVWGTCVPPGPHNQATLPENISQVINDAMQVVKSLGKRYLWVDQYCIDQNDHDIKSIQIGQMDLIYARALVTIVAAAGSDANYGLPGVSRGRGEHQPSVVSGGLEMFSSMPHVSHAIKNTTWNSRGW